MEQAAEDEGGHHPAQQGDVLHGRYQVLQRLGSGYFATVWLCQDRAEKRHVAVKVAKGGEAFADAAQDEISLLRCVNSMKKKDRAGENIVHLLDDFKMIGVNGFHVCSVFELLGPSLRCLMRIHGAQGLPLPFVKKALLQVLAGLHFLHKHCRIIHADIKPENILLHASEASLQSFLFDADAWNQSPGVGPLRSGDDLVRQLEPCDIMKLGVKIADLGSACWTYKPVCKEIQTQPYRALEVLLGLDYSTPADIWSTGCLAFEMVTGERLFDPRPGDCCSLDEGRARTGAGRGGGPGWPAGARPHLPLPRSHRSCHRAAGQHPAPHGPLLEGGRRLLQQARPWRRRRRGRAPARAAGGAGGAAGPGPRAGAGARQLPAARARARPRAPRHRPRLPAAPLAARAALAPAPPRGGAKARARDGGAGPDWRRRRQRRRGMEADEALLAPLRELGLPEAAARRALALTGNTSAEAAAQLYFGSLEAQEAAGRGGEYKMVLVVNTELSMGAGKTAAQAGHAAVGLYRLAEQQPAGREALQCWDECGAKKVVVQGTNAAHLMDLQALALSLELPTYLVRDAGRTQVPAGSCTVLAIMGEEETVNKVTGTLQLLN